MTLSVVTAQPSAASKIRISGNHRAAKGTLSRILRDAASAQRNKITSSKAGTVTSRAKSTSRNVEATMRSHDGEGDFDVQQYEQVDLEIQSLLPKVLCQENPAINAMVAILTTQFKTLPVPNTYTLYHSGICKSIQTLSGVTTSCVSAPATLLLNQY